MRAMAHHHLNELGWGCTLFGVGLSLNGIASIVSILALVVGACCHIVQTRLAVRQARRRPATPAPAPVPRRIRLLRPEDLETGD